MDIKTPTPLNLNGDTLEEWVRFKQKFFLYLEATEKSKKAGKVKVALLLCSMGEGCLDIFNTFKLDDNEKDDLDTVVKRFNSYFEPKCNTVVNRYKFFNMRQAVNESVDTFVTKLKSQAQKCKFEDQEEGLVRDLLIIGINDETAKEKLLIMDTDLKLDKAVQYCKAREESCKQIQIMKNLNSSKVLPLKYDDTFTKPAEVDKITYKSNCSFHKNTKSHNRVCSNCLTNHNFRNCPAWGKRCLKCHKMNHFAEACRSSKLNMIEVNKNDPKNEQIGDVEISSIMNVDSVNNKCWNQTLLVNGVEVKFKIDTGADVNVIPFNTYQQFGTRSGISPPKKFLKSYSGHSIDVLGSCLLNCNIPDSNSSFMEEFYVVNSQACPILGLKTCEELNLIKRVNNITSVNEQMFSEFSEVFNSTLGKLPFPYDIKLVDNYVPYISAARVVPKALKEKVKEEIQNMVKTGILEEVNEPSDWVHPIVIVKKPNDKIRICMDPRSLNKYIKREHYKMPTFQEIFAQLEGARYFSVFDASSAFLQVPLSPASSNLCTIATPFGRFRYRRLPFGLNSAPEVFQKSIDHVISGLEGVVSYIDDVLIFGNSKEEHDKRLRQFLMKAKQNNLKLSKEKSQISVENVTYLGHKLSPQGISLLESKVQAIQDYPRPKDKSDLQRFLGMITYVGRFISNLSDKTGVLRLLLSKDKAFMWTETEEVSFQKLKEELIKVPVLSYFDENKISVLSVDASKYGLGAVLIQDGHPIGYSSSALTDTQQRYSQIEKELLAVVNGCKKFHYYLYGIKFVIETDHKPLLGLLNKPISSLSPRLQRMVMELLRYNFKLVHVPGKNMYIADSLSRAPSGKSINTSYLENGAEVVYSLVTATDEVFERMKLATETDYALKKILDYINNGWPEHKCNTDIETQPYWSKRYELHTYENLVYLGNRLVIPETERFNILTQLHASHQGVNSCQNRAKTALYWPGMMTDIQNLVSKCTICQSYQKSNSKQPLQPSLVPEYPWEEIGIDFFKLNGKDHILVIDYHSKFVEIKKMNSTTADSVTTSLTQIFRSHGLPSKIHSDNGPPFDSERFKVFANNYQINLQTSSPLYPKSNGMVERAIQTIKSMLIKTVKSGGNPNLTLIDYNNTPKCNHKSPSQMLMGRMLRNVLPISKKILKPLFETEKTVQVLEREQEKQKKYYDRTAHQLEELKENQIVYLQKGIRDWVPAKVVRKHDSPDSYIVRTDNGGIYRRNRIHLRPMNI